jgi:diguanylate cyclase (GGDEF)-like protein
MFLRCGWLAGFVLIMGCAGANAAASATRPLDVHALGAPSFTVFTARDGVPDEAITAIETDKLGFVWLGSASTIAQFDGHSWQGSAPAGVRGLVRDLHLDNTGTLWAAFDAGGIAHYDGRRWHLENRASGLPTEHIFAIAETNDKAGQSTLWLATADAGLLRRIGQRWRPDVHNAQLPIGHIANLVQTKNILGRPLQWVSVGESGLWFREPEGDWQRYSPPEFRVSQVTDVVVAHDHGKEELWIVSYGNGLWRIDEDGLRSWQEELGEHSSTPMYTARATQTSEGDRILWIASRAGLMRLHDDRVQIFDRRHGLPSNAIRNLETSLSPDGVEILWITTEAGVARLTLIASPWQTPSLLGASGNGVFNVLIEPDGQGGERLWVAGARDGLGLLQDGRWRYFTLADGSLPHADTRSVQRVNDENGVPTLFVGPADGELLRVDDSFRFERMQSTWPKGPGQAVMQVFGRRFNSQHELWVATRLSGVYRLRDGQWTAMRAAGVADPWTIVRIAEHIDQAGKSWLWATTNQGLARFDGVQWDIVQMAEDLPDSTLIGLSVVTEKEGRTVLWMGSARSGVVRVDVTDPMQPDLLNADDLPAAPDPNVYGALHDSKGRIYVCTNNGVQQLTPRPEGGFDERIFQRRDGLVHEECNTNAQFIDAYDRYWIGTLGGLSVYDPNVQTQVHKPIPKTLHITEILINNHAVDIDTVKVPAGTRELRVSFALIAWQRENETRLRTQLIGYDPAPLPWTTQNFRTLGELPPGKYTLRIEGRDYTGLNSIPLEWPLEVLPAWWQRGSVRALLTLLALLAVGATMNWRLRSARAQQKQLQTQVDARTNELNAANLRLTELSYIDSLTGLANRRFLIDALYQSWATALEKKQQLAAIVLDVDHFKAYNDQHGHLAGDQALRDVAQAMRSVAGSAAVVARYGGEEFACVMQDATLDQARAIAERIRASVAALSLQTPSGTSVSITISAGVAAWLPSTTRHPDDLLREADDALYRAKREGRNRVCVADLN